MKLRHARTGSAGQLDTFPSTQNLRRRIESSRVLRGVKRGINAGLRLTRAGDVRRGVRRETALITAAAIHKVLRRSGTSGLVLPRRLRVMSAGLPIPG